MEYFKFISILLSTIILLLIIKIYLILKIGLKYVKIATASR